MAKTKAKWIEEIHALDKEHPGTLGDVSQEELEAMTIPTLRQLKKDMEADIESDSGDKKVAPEMEIPGGNQDGSFQSMCGEEYDPKKTGECHKQCSKDFPEAFEACTENYKQLDVGRTTKKRVGLGKTAWGHMNGKQGGLIDQWFLENKEPATLAEICEFCGGREPRVMHHMKHLVADLDIVILYNDRKIDEDGKKKKVRQYWWADKDKRRKGEPLEGKSAYPQK